MEEQLACNGPLIYGLPRGMVLLRAVQVMSNDNSELEERRRILRRAMLGGVVGAAFLPERWVRPVVDAVVVPAHAQTSPRFTTTSTTTTTTSTTTTTGTGSS